MKDLVTSRREFLKVATAFAAASALAACKTPTSAPTEEGAAAEPTAAVAVEEIQPGVPRDQCLILENPTGTVLPADDFNRWRSGSNTYSTGFQQLALDALWYIDPDAGVNGVWDNALAAEKPIYNADYTQMTVKAPPGSLLERRRGVHRG